MNKFFLYAITAGLLSSCVSSKKTPMKDQEISESLLEKEILNTLNEEGEQKPYNPSESRINDLLHTKLDVKFDYSKAYLYGKATLTFKPYFYPVSSLILDAKGFDISKVELLDKEEKQSTEAKYKYDGNFLTIDLGKIVQRTDTFKVYIEYTAKPNERQTGGSEAISSDKGLYFINPLGTDSTKPTQIWTQGETEASSAWFPTIDSPNERMTQEIYITANNKYQTLSNGTLQFSIDNGDETHTDYWKQDLPHAPYLTMMAVGDFAIVKDKWRNIDVNYYVEKKYEPAAREIFGHTPEMLEFYSKTLGVDYAWDKYHQVVVREYVSGAMENTSAVIFGEFIQRTHREMIDDDDESTVAHELFHHWFGDLVTCESWANLPLNESFATYGEYLWIEHKYGREAADHHIQDGMNQYLAESKQKQVNLIRFDYEEKEDMFDSHSYAKGGRILHMLRKYVGDEAFFESLKLYLNTNKFNTVEIHQLRLAFEKVTGEDLNWFFSQWFLASGHPNLAIKSRYDAANKKAIIEISQNQDIEKTPLYQLPLSVDIYVGRNKTRHKINVTKAEEAFSFDCAQQPDLINTDAEKMLLGVKNESKTKEEWVFQYRNAPLYLDRFEALENLGKVGDSLATEIIKEALNDKYWNIRVAAIKYSRNVNKAKTKEIQEKLISMIKSDSNSKVRAAAIKQVSFMNSDQAMLEIYKTAIKDSSYLVMGEALGAISLIDGKEAMRIAKTIEREESSKLLTSIAGIYSLNGGDSENQFFIDAIKKLNGFNRYGVISLYPRLLANCSDETVNKALPVLEDVSKSEGVWWMRLAGMQALGQVYGIYVQKEMQYQELLKKAEPGAIDLLELKKKSEDATAQKTKVFNILHSIRNTEKNENLIQLLEAFR